MNLNTWLDSEAGRATKLASHFCRTRGAITQWRTNGVPVHLMKAVRDFTNNEVTLEDMIPEASDQHTSIIASDTTGALANTQAEQEQAVA